MTATQEIESAQALKEQVELREQAQTAEAFIAANIIILESKFALEGTPEFVAVRPEGFWNGESFKMVEFETTTYNGIYNGMRWKFEVERRSNRLDITVYPHANRDRAQRTLKANGSLPYPFITVLEYDTTGTHGPHSDNGPGWAFIMARMHLATWFGKTDPVEIIRPFWNEKDLSLANILARTQRGISSSDSR